MAGVAALAPVQCYPVLWTFMCEVGLMRCHPGSWLPRGMLVFVLLGGCFGLPDARKAQAGENATAAPSQENLTPAERGLYRLRHEAYAPAEFDEALFDRLWNSGRRN